MQLNATHLKYIGIPLPTELPLKMPATASQPPRQLLNYGTSLSTELKLAKMAEMSYAHDV